MQGIKDVAARDARRARVRLLYDDALTQQAIADELGVSLPTVCKDVAVLAAAGLIRKRGRGEAIAVSLQRYWSSETGVEERERRSERMRTAPPVVRTCESCGGQFELSASRARQQPGRFCSVQCHGESKRSGGGLEALRAGRRQWRAEVARLKTESGLTDLDGVVQALPRDLRRSQAALSGHIAKGHLVPVPNELGLLLFTDEAIANYTAWLRSHPDGRLRRFNPDTEEKARWRAGTWTKARHGTEASARAFGHMAGVIAAGDGKKVGHPGFSNEKQAQILELRRTSPGLSIRALARIAQVKKGQVERLLSREAAVHRQAPSRRQEVAALLEERPWRTLKEIAAPRNAAIPGVGADWRAIRDVLVGSPDLFERRTGEAAHALGRQASAVVWGLRSGELSRNPPVAA